MEDFLRDNYRFLTNSVEILAAVMGLIVYKKYKFTAAKYFIWFLMCLTLCDFISFYTWYVRSDKFLSFLIGTAIERNHWWTTLYWKIGAIVFFVFYYHKILKTKIFKRIIKISGGTFFAFSIFYITLHWEAFFNRFFPIISILGAIIVFMCVVFYFTETLQSDRILTFYKSLNFYISFAILIWWLIITPLVFYDVYYVYEINIGYVDKAFDRLRKEIYLLANMFMYLTFTFALIWCKSEDD